jgi:hypothetical protein
VEVLSNGSDLVENAHLIEEVSSDLQSMHMSKTIKIKKLCKSYMSDAGTAVQALDNLSLDMYKGVSVYMYLTC